MSRDPIMDQIIDLGKRIFESQRAQGLMQVIPSTFMKRAREREREELIETVNRWKFEGKL